MSGVTVSIPLVAKLEKASSQQAIDTLARNIAQMLLGDMRERIHEQGKKTDGAKIGTYSKGYMVVRTGNYKNAIRYKKGKNKGKIKNAGTFTDLVIRFDKNTGVFSNYEKIGTARPSYNRGSDTDIILSLTRQMENDWSIIPLGNATYGLGFKNSFNAQKAEWGEERYGRVYGLTKEEKQSVVDEVNEWIKAQL